MFFTDNEKGSVFKMLPFLLFLKAIFKIVLRPIPENRTNQFPGCLICPIFRTEFEKVSNYLCVSDVIFPRNSVE